MESLGSFGSTGLTATRSNVYRDIIDDGDTAPLVLEVASHEYDLERVQDGSPEGQDVRRCTYI